MGGVPQNGRRRMAGVSSSRSETVGVLGSERWAPATFRVKFYVCILHANPIPIIKKLLLSRKTKLKERYRLYRLVLLPRSLPPWEGSENLRTWAL
jgi:hypothetical protein